MVVGQEGARWEGRVGREHVAGVEVGDCDLVFAKRERLGAS